MKTHSLFCGIVPVLALSLLWATPSTAQHTFNSSVAQYYRDGFLWNPAMAGEKHARFYGLYSGAWSGFDGAASEVGIAADTKLGKSMGIGINLSSHTAGAFRQYAGAVAYSYQLQFDETASLRLGGDLSLYKDHLDAKELTSGGQADPVAEAFNEKSVQFNGDFGADYRTGGFNLGATAYNLGAYFQKAGDREADLQIFQAVGSYRFTLPGDQLSLEPLAAYKMFYQSDNIFLAAAQFEYQDVFHTSIYWESTGSVMGGLGFMVSKWGELNFFYTSKNKYGFHDQYEAGIKVLLQ